MLRIKQNITIHTSLNKKLKKNLLEIQWQQIILILLKLVHSIGCQQQGHIINGTKLFHFPKVQQEFTKKIGFSSLSLGGMFLADDPLIYYACPTVAHLVGSQHNGQNLAFVQIVQLFIIQKVPFLFDSILFIRSNK